MDNPNCLAVIMDGNRRWAIKNGLSIFDGHKQGVKSIKKIIKLSIEKNINNLVLYAFSTENWSRPAKEVSGLLKLFEWYLKSEIAELNNQNIRLRFIGEKSVFSSKIVNIMNYSQELTKKNTKLNLYIAVNYGGKNDLLYSFQKALKEIKNKNFLDKDINFETIRSNLLSKEVPDVDLLIRTSGEKRLSNFLLWQLAYSELYFTDVLWPDFNENEMQKALDFYYLRDRRFGSSNIKTKTI